MHMEYSIYIIMNIINNKVYIGMTKQNVKRRWNDHSKPSAKFCYRLVRAIRKYGKNSFTINILEKNLTLAEAIDKEKEYIIKYDSTNYKKGYNVSAGGLGNNSPMSYEAKEKLKKYSGEKNSQFGKIRSDEHRKRISDSLKGHVVSKETRLKISSTLKNKFK